MLKHGGMILMGKLKNSREKSLPVPLCPTEIPFGVTQAKTWASKVRQENLRLRNAELTFHC
jgi:hypothetical protein